MVSLLIQFIRLIDLGVKLISPTTLVTLEKSNSSFSIYEIIWEKKSLIKIFVMATNWLAAIQIFFWFLPIVLLLSNFCLLAYFFLQIFQIWIFLDIGKFWILNSSLLGPSLCPHNHYFAQYFDTVRVHGSVLLLRAV